MKPTTPTEHHIIELSAKMARYEIALQSCLITARNGAVDDDQFAKAHLKYIEKEAEKALNGEEVAEV